jgi:hypothetical protein
VAHGFLDAGVGSEAVAIGKLINAFFRWEFNSCETLVHGDQVYPIDYANAAPDVSLTSLHYYFPWAIKTLVKWSIFCCATGRKMRVDQDMYRYYEIGDRDDLSYEKKIEEYLRMAEDYFEVERYNEFCNAHLKEIDEVMVDFIKSPEFDDILVETVVTTFPAHEHEKFVAHYRGLLASWVEDQPYP